MKADRQKVKLKERMLDVLFRIIHYGCLTLGFTFVIVFVVGPILWQKAFGPEKELVIIDQEVGGKLICNSIYNADIHSWYYDLDYDYEDVEGNMYQIGSVRYTNLEWRYNEQVTLLNGKFSLVSKENIE